MIMKTEEQKEADRTETEYVNNISVELYKELLGPRDVASMIKKDGDSGQKLAIRAMAYNSTVRATLKVIRRNHVQS